MENLESSDSDEHHEDKKNKVKNKKTHKKSKTNIDDDKIIKKIKKNDIIKKDIKQNKKRSVDKYDEYESSDNDEMEKKETVKQKYKIRKYKD